MKVCLCTWYNDNIKSYATTISLINQIYCKKHHIDFFVDHKCRINNPYYERFPLILELFKKNYDYVIWIDADAFFFVNSPHILNLINQHSNKDFILSQDSDYGINEDYNYIVTKDDISKINSGVMIIKNTDYAKFIIYNWFTNKDWQNISKYYFYLDQGVIRWLIHTNAYNMRDKSYVVPFGYLQQFAVKTTTQHDITDDIINKYKLTSNSPFIFHMAGSDRTFRDYCAMLYYINYCYL